MIDKLFKKSEDIVCRKIGEDMILVPITNNVGDMESIYTLNTVGARIWELIDGNNSAGDIGKIICSEFEVTDTQIQSDLIEFLDSMEKIKAIKES